MVTINICHDVKDYPHFRCVEIAARRTQDFIMCKGTEAVILLISLLLYRLPQISQK